ncbi:MULTISPECIES: hypothetical protein [unclassified Sphingobacterium]|jgi:hypothetical protein|uniref:hypothetical protein n=1 Tax=unclassified Sphingobacterium TaxID=2609468 RepID=UPI00295592EA|nr:hypothetical protein [Sphingobacterium sp. UGAL515B_05]WON92188.1 hypothetical protein OK025_13155 [Sphingobacterium sp. UGAL515B_05]
MRTLSFVVFGKNTDILLTLKRIIESNTSWHAIVQEELGACKSYLRDNPVDVILLSSGLSQQEEKEITDHLSLLNYPIGLIQHYGGGSGLLKNEVYSLFPELVTE